VPVLSRLEPALRLSAVATTIFLVVACGVDDTEGEVDAATDAGTDTLGIAPPETPVFTPCPEGWREVIDADGMTSCEPYPEGGAQDCPEGQAHFVGEPGCRQVGPPCPADGLPADLPAGRPVVYVLQGATGGDGSRARPLGDLADVPWSSMPPGSILAIGRGRYNAALLVPAGITIHGACVNDTVLSPGWSTTEYGVINARGPGLEVYALTIQNTGLGGIFALQPGYTAHVEGVVIDRATGAGAVVYNGASLTMRDVVIRETRPDPVACAKAVIALGADASADLSRMVIEGHCQVAVDANDSATVTLVDSVVRDTDSRADGELGWGVGVRAGARVHVERSLIERNRHSGVDATGPGSTASLTDVVIRDTESQRLEEGAGRAVGGFNGASIELQRVAFDRNRDAGVLVFSDVTLRGSDILVRDTRGAGHGIGLGFHIQDATADLERVVVADSRGMGIHARQGSVVDLRDVFVYRTRGRETDDLFGTALWVLDGASVSAERIVLADNRNASVISVHPESTVSLLDAVIQRTLPESCPPEGCPEYHLSGTGALAIMGASLTMERFLVEESSFCGLQIAEGGQMDASHGTVRHNVIGACNSDASFDIARLQDDVTYLENESNLDTTMLPVPSYDPATMTPDT
jgi:hypothetical protein